MQMLLAFHRQGSKMSTEKEKKKKNSPKPTPFQERNNITANMFF